MSADKQTRMVRAWNVRIGDELSFFDSKKQREQMMLVVGFDLSFPGVQQLFLRRGKTGKASYRWNMKRGSLVRVRR